MAPAGVISSRKMGEVMPKLASGVSLLKTVGKVPSDTAVPQVTLLGLLGTQFGGKVWPMVTEPACRYRRSG